MSTLFEGTSINGMKLSNRFVRSATYEGMAAPDGSCTDSLIGKMAELAEGGIGLIITSHAFVSPEGRARNRQIGIHSDAMIPSLRKMAEAVHESGGRIVAQLAHTGAQTDRGISGFEALGPSVFEKEKGCISEEMNAADRVRIAACFGDAAVRAQRAGFDGVEIHGAHGYLLSQFLSPHFNKRTDGYGGSIENRARFLLEVLEEMRARTGNGYPNKISCKISLDRQSRPPILLPVENNVLSNIKEMRDEFAMLSQQKAREAIAAGRFKDEIVPVSIHQRKGLP